MRNFQRGVLDPSWLPEGFSCTNEQAIGEVARLCRHTLRVERKLYQQMVRFYLAPEEPAFE